MRIDSWNVNGIMPKLEKEELTPLWERVPDVVCIQEIRTSEEPEVLPGYHHIWNHAARGGIWGTLVLSKVEPIHVVRELGIPDIDREGRMVACEFPGLWLVNVYFPNARGSLRRKAVRREWDEAITEFVFGLASQKTVVVCGDFNTTISDEDIYEESIWRGRDDEEGFPSDERSHISEMLESGFIDAFRFVHPDRRNAYTWWSNRRKRREVNRGWRFDYFLVSGDAKWDIVSCDHLTDVMGSDHCPIELVIDR